MSGLLPAAKPRAPGTGPDFPPGPATGLPVRDHHHKVRAGTEEEGGVYAEPHIVSPAAHHFDLFYRKHFLGRMDVVIRHQNPHSHPARLNNTFNLAKSFG